MEIRQIDQLFKNKLKTATAEPKVESWDKLEAMLDSEKPKAILWIWKVAAVILVLLVSVFAINWRTNDQPIQKLAVKDHQEVLKNDVNISNSELQSLENETDHISDLTIDMLKEAKAPATVKTLPLKKIKQLNDDVSTKIELKESIESNQVENHLAAATVDTINTLVERKKLPIKITFKRSAIQSNDQLALANTRADTTNNKSFKEILDKTRQLNPSELMADIRDAKDEFLSDPFNIKKNKVKNSNK